MKRALYIDTFSNGHMHEVYDASSLLMFSYMYDEIEYFANMDSASNVKQLLGGFPKNVIYKEINLVNQYRGSERINRIARFIKQIQVMFLNPWYIYRAPKGVDVILNYNTIQSLPLVNWIAKKRSDCRILQVCHGEMYDLTNTRKVSGLFKWGMNVLVNPDKLIADNLWFAVLGEGIKKNVLPLVSQKVRDKLLCFDHTAIFSSRPLPFVSDSSKLTIGFIGGFRGSKGADLFLRLARAFKDNREVEFRIIGHTYGQKKILQEAGVVIPDGVGDYFLNRDAMFCHISHLDYILYCFPPDLYRFTASGSLFDAIEAERPIIALKNDFFSGLFYTCGEFGYLEPTEDALYERISSLAKDKRIGVSSMKFNMEYIKTQLLPESAAMRFSSQWN